MTRLFIQPLAGTSSVRFEDEYLKKAAEAAHHGLEMKVRDCLERWISELEPVLCFDARTNEFMGLSIAGDQTGYVTIMVEARSFREINAEKRGPRRFDQAFAQV